MSYQYISCFQSILDSMSTEDVTNICISKFDQKTHVKKYEFERKFE